MRDQATNNKQDNGKSKEDNNNGGSYRESYGGRGEKQEDNFSNERGGWESDRSGHEREGYGLKKNYVRVGRRRRIVKS